MINGFNLLELEPTFNSEEGLGKLRLYEGKFVRPFEILA